MKQKIEKAKMSVNIDLISYKFDIFYKKGGYFAENFANDASEAIRFLCKVKNISFENNKKHIINDYIIHSLGEKNSSWQTIKVQDSNPEYFIHHIFPKNLFQTIECEEETRLMGCEILLDDNSLFYMNI